MSKANTRTNWSDEDYLFLKKHYEELTYKEIGEKIGKTKSAVQNKMRILGLQKPDKYYYNKHFFDVIDTEEKAYWLGFFYADGYVCRTRTNAEVAIELQVSDISHLKKLNKSMCGNVAPTIRKREREGIDFVYEIASIRFYSIDLFNGLSVNGCCERKTNKIALPKLSNHLTWCFLRGFFDGDGCLVLNKSRNALKFDFCSSSLIILEQIKMFLFENGIYSYINQQKMSRGTFKTTMPNYRLFISGLENSYLFGQKLYQDATIYLDRKFNKYNSIILEYNIPYRIKNHNGLHHQS